MGNTSKRYSAEFKQRAAALLRSSDDSASVVTKGLGIDDGTLRNWAGQADEPEGGAASQNPFQMAEEPERLRRENARPRTAIERRRPGQGRARHSDRGSQYASPLLGRTMKRYGIVPSMGSVASPWDNAPTESLMGTTKSERVHARTFATKDEAVLEIFDHLGCPHDRLRLRSALGCMSPGEYENKYWPKPLAV